ncbi:lytic transglycosylase domain-containing protein [Teichococcus oryzae]|nr:lytic transglycosylase domain-containing protein [Pseudoroseomonas oryzae]
MLRHLASAALLAMFLSLHSGARAESDDWAACRQAIAAAEPGAGVPPGLLAAIALVETGRRSPTGSPQPWPWSVNAEGQSYYAPSKAAAISRVRQIQERGVRSIDVGCMQVNLLHHPDAFSSLEEAFDPAANLRYAARFLRSLQAQTGDWGTAIGRYHSGEAERGLAYSRRVALARLGKAWGGGGPVPLSREAVGDVCAAGLRPALLFGGAQEARRFMTLEARRANRAVPVPPAARKPRLVCLRPERLAGR